ncbi:hypothetical protein BV20DRAFT_972604 [Pilatotrama ljubarskyi]|nr:hypothetical protein BV20DRAFT_972604 [Pilatotrama ljubarskyi]
MPTSELLLLAPELLMRILLELDAHDLAVCRAVCKLLRALAGSSLVQYKHTLALSAMKNGPLHGPAIAVRLTAIRTYRAAWASYALQPNTELMRYFMADGRVQSFQPEFRRFMGPLIGFLAGSLLTLWCAPSPIRGLEAQTWSWDLQLSAFELQQGIVDLSQDVAVACGIDTVDRSNAQCHILTFWPNGRMVHHPAAAQPVISVHAPRAHVSEIALRGDLLSLSLWGAFDSTVVKLYNWKTGLLLGEFTSLPLDWVHHVFLDDCTLIISNQNHLWVYVVDHAGAVPPLAAAPDYILRLPGDNDHQQKSDVIDLTCNESLAAADHVGLFGPDPDATLLSVRFALTCCNIFHRCHGRQRYRDYNLCIPRLALLCLLKSSMPRPPGRTVELQWEEWSHRGSLLLRTRHETLRGSLVPTSFLGSRFALAIDSSQEDPPYISRTDVYIFEAHLHAQSDGPEAERAREHASRYINFGATGIETDGCSCFPAARTSLPYRIIHKEIVYEEHDEMAIYESSRVVMLDDGVALLREGSHPVTYQKMITKCYTFSV